MSKCKICKGNGTLPMEDDSEYDEGFCDCGNCNGTGEEPKNKQKTKASEVRDEKKV